MPPSRRKSDGIYAETRERVASMLREVNAKLDELLAAPRLEDEIEHALVDGERGEAEREAAVAANRRPK